jgi:signal transduction histidine kinase
MLDFSCDNPHTVTIESKQKNTIDEIDLLSLHFTKLTAKIEDQFKHLKEANIQRRELVSNISHDLRTPLAVSKGYIETLCFKNNQLNKAERLYYLHIAQRSIEQLAILIDDLFELSKLEAGQIALKCEAFSLLELIYDTVQEFDILSANKNITIHIPSPTHNVMVCADIALIQRVFANLIANAIKFTPQNGSVSINFCVEGKRITIYISDTGCGIAEQDLAHIFERYYFKNQAVKPNQGSQTTPNKDTSENTSSGLGLAIVKKILELHDCHIKVSNLDNQGSQFKFHLPAP